MVHRLDANIVDLIREGENERVIMRTFDGAYRRWRVFPAKKIYKTQLCCSAVKFDHKDLVRYLLETGFDVNYTPSFSELTPSPLNVAIHLGREDCMKMLLNAGARVDIENRFSEDRVVIENFFNQDDLTERVTAIELAVMEDRTDLVKLMIPLYDRKTTKDQRTPLHLACLHGAQQCLDYILSTVEGQNDVNTLDSDDPLRPNGYSPLMLGLHQGEWLVKRILQAGGNAKHVTGRSKFSVLHIACSSNLFKTYLTHDGFFPQDLSLPKIIELLIESGCDPNVSSAEGETPLSRLCAQVLCQLKARQKRILYDFASHREAVLGAVSILLEHGAYPDGNIEQVPLSVLIWELNTILRLFVDCGETKYQELLFPSALQATMLTRDLFRLLLLHRANPNIISFGSANSITGYIVDDLLEVILYNWSPWTRNRSEGMADIVSVIADVFRLLLLFGGKLHEPILLFKVYERCVPGWSLFLTFYLNFGGRPDIELQMKRYHMQLNTVVTHLTEFEVFIQDQPILLKNLVRIAILRSVGSHAVLSVPALKLPTALTDYILSLE